MTPGSPPSYQACALLVAGAGPLPLADARLVSSLPHGRRVRESADVGLAPRRVRRELAFSWLSMSPPGARTTSGAAVERLPGPPRHGWAPGAR